MTNYKDKFQLREYYCIEYGELENIIKEHFNIKINIPYSLELTNDSYYVFYAEPNELLLNCSEDEINNYEVFEYVNHLCTLGLIPEGNILVEIFW